MKGNDEVQLFIPFVICKHNANFTIYLNKMARTISRGQKMDTRIFFRCTEEDRVAVKLEAQKHGKDMSCYIRDLLIREKVITPLVTGESF